MNNVFVVNKHYSNCIPCLVTLLCTTRLGGFVEYNTRLLLLQYTQRFTHFGKCSDGFVQMFLFMCCT